jgi:hypothetical protein
VVDERCVMRQRRSRAALRTLLPVLFVMLFAGVLPEQARGAVAPAFTLPLLDGKTILRLADMKGSPIILLFWAPW